MDLQEEISTLANDFDQCRKILIALGDENRLELLTKMMQMGNCNGVRVVEITECVHLSRPAVSHHLQILKDAGIIKMRKEGTKTYYYFDSDLAAFDQLIETLQLAKSITSRLPERRTLEE